MSATLTYYIPIISITPHLRLIVGGAVGSVIWFEKSDSKSKESIVFKNHLKL